MARANGLQLPYASGTKRSDRMLTALRLVNARGEIPIAALAGTLGVSVPTMRRDLAAMADEGLLIRTHGGARALSVHDEVPVRLRGHEAAEAKQRIAVRAAELVPAGPTVVALNGGTTTAEIARALGRRKRLTIVTNALTVALELAARPGATVVVTGGVVRSASLEAVGPLAEHAYRVLQVGTAILGVDGFSVAAGATTHDETEARTSRAMAEQAQHVMVAADGSKIGRVTLARIADAARIDLLVTDTSADPEELDRLRDLGVAVHLVELHR